MNKANKRTRLSMNDLATYLKREHRSYLDDKPKDIPVSATTITASEVLSGVLWEHEDFSVPLTSERVIPSKTVQLYIVVAGDNQSPCRWNGRQLAVEWIKEEQGVPLFTCGQAKELIKQTYQFFESVGRTAHPILRAVPVFQLGNL